MTAPAAQGAANPNAALPGFIIYRSEAALLALDEQLGKRLLFRLLNVIISIGISIGLFFLFKAEVGGVFFWFLVISAALSVLQLLFHLGRWLRARSIGRKVQPTPQLQVDVLGLVLAQDGEALRVPWERVCAVCVKNHFWTPGPKLEVRWLAGGDQPQTWRTEMILLDTKATLLDSALRAYSRGRFGLDLSRVDRLW